MRLCIIPMSLRFFSLLLSVPLLVFVSACSTTAPGPDTPPPYEPPIQEESTDREAPIEPEIGLEHPSWRSVTEVLELSRISTDDVQGLALEIVRSLESIPSGQLAGMIESGAYDATFTEWLELTRLVRRTLMKDVPVNSAAQHWQDYHYGHAIDRAGFPVLVSSYADYFPSPARVAVLLPTEGGLAAAGRAIRDGIISAYMEQPGDTVVRFYSSGDTDESALAAYDLAIAEGATQVIGPLRVESARALAGIGHHDVPVLLLNDPARDPEPDPRPDFGQATGLSSLSLSQTEEAAAIAEKVIARGQSRAIVIVPENAWGQRMETAFSTQFVQRGGQIPASARFSPATSDHSAVLTHMLKIDESRQRKQDLQSRLGIPLQFEPVRRDDFDFIFLAASPAQGRELKPLFKFHDAGEVPVYAMGRVYSGRMGEKSDLDLDGVIFPIAPWQLEAARGSMPALESLRLGSFGNLFALGRDAWQLLPWFPLLQKDPDLGFQGNTGKLSLQANGKLSRQHAWAQFANGLPTSYEWPDQH